MKFYVDLLGLVKENEEWAGVPFFRFTYKPDIKKLSIRFFRTEKDNGIIYSGEVTRKTAVETVVKSLKVSVMKKAKKDAIRMARRIITWFFSQLDEGKPLSPNVGAIFCESELMQPKESQEAAKYEEESKKAIDALKAASKKTTDAIRSRLASGTVVEVDFTLTLTTDKETKRFKRFVVTANTAGITGMFYLPKGTPDSLTVKITG